MKSEIDVSMCLRIGYLQEAFCVFGAASKDSPNLPEGAEKLYFRSAARWFCMDLHVYDYEPTG